ncbi:MAG TPA: DUF3127 domain-containing protein [Saprospiraceae bacterium]|nr:DUF3127 domain-containing protein [Saprospiraceae bacterium]
MEIRGKIIQTLPLQTGEGKNGTWKKQEYILETLESYPKKICFNVWGEKVDQFLIKDEETITLHFDLESREFNGRWYTDVKAWRVDRNIGGSQPENQQQNQSMEPQRQAADLNDMDDDLPF